MKREESKREGSEVRPGLRRRRWREESPIVWGVHCFLRGRLRRCKLSGFCWPKRLDSPFELERSVGWIGFRCSSGDLLVPDRRWRLWREERELKRCWCLVQCLLIVVEGKGKRGVFCMWNLVWIGTWCPRDTRFYGLVIMQSKRILLLSRSLFPHLDSPSALLSHGIYFLTIKNTFFFLLYHWTYFFPFL